MGLSLVGKRKVLLIPRGAFGKGGTHDAVDFALGAVFLPVQHYRCEVSLGANAGFAGSAGTAGIVYASKSKFPFLLVSA